MAFPPCPSCKAALSISRVLRTSAELHPAEPSERTAAVSCSGCLAVIELEDGGSGRYWVAREVMAPNASLRLRDRLTQANESGRLEQELRALFSNPTTAVLLGTPELFEFVSIAFGASVRLRETATLGGNSADLGSDFPAPASRLRASEGGDLEKGRTLALRAVREGVLLCEDETGMYLVHPALVDPA